MAENLPGRVKRYIQLSLIPVATVILVAAALDPHSSVNGAWPVYLLFFAIGMAGEEYRVMTRNSIRLTMTAAVHLPLILLFTPLEATLIAMTSCLCSQMRRRRPPYRTTYNTVARGISVGIPALMLAYWRLHDHAFHSQHVFLTANVLQGAAHQGQAIMPWPHVLFSIEVLVGCLIAALLYFALDSALFVAVVSVQTATNPLAAWQANMRASILPEVTKSVIGIIAACVYVINPLFVILIVLPVAVTHVTTQQIFRLEHETIDAVTALADAIDYRDPYTAQHSVRVADISRRLAQRLGLSREQLDEITLAARVHDLGKIGIPNDILLKNGKLTAEEMAVMQTHPRIGVEVLQQYRNFQRALPIVLHHHERYDGKGYPDGLCSHDIPLGAQIIAHADAFDAMTSDRPYRKGLRPEMALQRVSEATGTQFDPVVAGVFVAMIREDLAAAGQSLPDTGGSLAEPTPVPRAAGDDKVRYLYK